MDDAGIDTAFEASKGWTCQQSGSPDEVAVVGSTVLPEQLPDPAVAAAVVSDQGRAEKRRERVSTEARRQVATVTIYWASFSNEDMGEDEPDEGWYIDLDVEDESFTVGPDFYGPGCKTFDEALALVLKWAGGRNLKVDTEMFSLPVFNRS